VMADNRREYLVYAVRVAQRLIYSPSRRRRVSADIGG
jgi:hypothetical protein